MKKLSIAILQGFVCSVLFYLIYSLWIGLLLSISNSPAHKWNDNVTLIMDIVVYLIFVLVLYFRDKKTK